jgi:hypothetical protein
LASSDSVFRRHLASETGDDGTSEQRPTGPAINDVEVTEFVPNSVFTLASRSGPTPFTYRYRLSPQGKNTQLRLEGEISGEGLGRGFALVAPFAERLFERGMRANLATLKQILELS